MSNRPNAMPELSQAKKDLLARWQKNGVPGAAEAIVPRAAGTRVLISADQYRIWLHQNMNPGRPLYNEICSLEYAGPLDSALLQQAFDMFLAKHEAWRTTFVRDNEEVLQQVHVAVPSQIEFVDLSHLEESVQRQEELRLATESASQHFNLSKGPLFRLLCVRLNEQIHHLHLAIHHIIFDGTSGRDIFAPQLASLYAALVRGEVPDTTPGSVQYADYSLWRQAQLASEHVRVKDDFWKQKLAGELTPIRLPMDRPRPASISQYGAMEAFELTRTLADKLKKYASTHGATVNMVMLASLKLLLFRYSSQQDVIVGTVANGRRRSELQTVMGYMVDTMPVRTQVDPAMSFTDYLRHVRKAVLEALGKADLPFDRIVKVSGSKRDPSYHPIFQTFFSYLSNPNALPAGWSVMPRSVDTGIAKFDLYVEVEERGDDLSGSVIYSTDIFERTTIQRLIGHWTVLMEAACDAPTEQVGKLPLLCSDECDQILHQWNETAMPLPLETVPQLIAGVAKRQPERIAVQFENEQLTYRELDEAAERIAVHLRNAGAKPGVLVAIFLERSEWLPVGLLAILKSGAGYLPLDPKTPQSRIELCLEDAKPVVVLTQISLRGAFMTDARLLTMEECSKAVVTTVQGIAPSLEDTAYVIHTSGSTGRPKGVELQHHALLNLLVSMQQKPGFTETDVLLAVTTISFDIATMEMFLPLITGGRLVIASYAATRDPHALSKLLVNSKATVMQATPATWRAMLAADWKGKAGLKVLCGGEAMTRDMAEKMLMLRVDLWNVYGPTETTIWSTVYQVKSGNGTVPVGRPIGNTKAYILDQQQQPVPVGVAGELYLGGDGVAVGYRGQLELTEQKFVRPAVAEGARLYRTGDYAVYREDGTIECQGRMDNQVKVRGHRIELEEVELHLNAHPDVAIGTARTWPDKAGGHRLCGYFVAKKGKELTAGVMRDFLRSRLPDYMIPSEFMPMESLPMTANGKVDRKALPEAKAAQPVDTNDMPFDLEEEKIARIWCEVLGLNAIHREDNFFDLGGHSLLLVVLFSRINKELGTSLPITTIFDAQTFGAFMCVLHNQAKLSPLVAVQSKGSRPPLFIVHSYLIYHALASSMGEEQPVYGLRELESDGVMTIEERAQRYFACMQQVQPTGPYHVAGWCAAGPLTVEVAKCALLAGEEVAPAILFDAWLPGYEEKMRSSEQAPRGLKRLRRPVTSFLQQVKQQPMRWWPVVTLRILKRRIIHARDVYYVKHLDRVIAISNTLHISLPQFMHNTTLQTFASFQSYKAEPLQLGIQLIRAQETIQIPGAEEDCGWASVAMEGVEVAFAPGDHETMFKAPHLGKTASLVRCAMDGKPLVDEVASQMEKARTKDVVYA